MTMRSVDTRFWADGWIRKLNALERYLFLYLLTNDKTNWCGIYELDISMIAFESGIDERDLERSLLPRLIPKIIYMDGWVYIPNFPKYHLNGTKDTKKGYEKAFDSVPERIRLIIREIEKSGVAPPTLPSSAFAFASSSAPAYEIVSDSERTPKKGKADASGFNLFWEGYPNKADKVSAFAAWKVLSQEKKSAALKDFILRASSDAWTKDGGKYVPLAKTYLKNERWEDPITQGTKIETYVV